MTDDWKNYPDPEAWRLEAELWGDDNDDTNHEEREFMDALDALANMPTRELYNYFGVPPQAEPNQEGGRTTMIRIGNTFVFRNYILSFDIHHEPETQQKCLLVLVNPQAIVSDVYVGTSWAAIGSIPAPDNFDLEKFCDTFWHKCRQGVPFDLMQIIEEIFSDAGR